MVPTFTAGEFSYSYPNYGSKCGGEVDVRDATYDDDLSDGQTSHHWSDGTRYFSRFYAQYRIRDTIFESVKTSVVWLSPQGSLTGVEATYDTDFGEMRHELVGKRIGAKDQLAVGLELLGELGKRPDGGSIAGYNVVVSGSHSYVVGPRGLDIIDVAKPGKPRWLGGLGTIADPKSYNDVRFFAQGTKKYVFAASAQTDVIDVTDPSAPKLVANLDSYSHSLQIDTSGAKPLLYLADYTNTIPRFDITEPVVPLPMELIRLPLLSRVHDLTARGAELVVNGSGGGMLAIELVANPAEPIVKATLPSAFSHASAVGVTTSGRRVILHGDEGMMPNEGGAFLRILAGNPTLPTYGQELARYQSRKQVSIHNIEMSGDRAYLAYYHDGVRILDIADPSAPREVAHYNTFDFANGPSDPFAGALSVKVVDGLLYVADSERGLMIMRETQ